MTTWGILTKSDPEIDQETLLRIKDYRHNLRKTLTETYTNGSFVYEKRMDLKDEIRKLGEFLDKHGSRSMRGYVVTRGGGVKAA